MHEYRSQIRAALIQRRSARGRISVLWRMRIRSRTKGDTNRPGAIPARTWGDSRTARVDRSARLRSDLGGLHIAAFQTLGESTFVAHGGARRRGLESRGIIPLLACRRQAFFGWWANRSPSEPTSPLIHPVQKTEATLTFERSAEQEKPARDMLGHLCTLNSRSIGTALLLAEHA